jgi:integrin beta 2
VPSLESFEIITVFQVLSQGVPEHPFDMTIYGEFLFWTDWVQHAVIRANKYTGEDVTWLRSGVPRPMGIVTVYNNTNDCTYFVLFMYCSLTLY